MTTITQGATTITPTLVLGYESPSTSGNILHTLVNGTVKVSLVPDAPRAGTLKLLFASRSAAFAARALHAASGVFVLADPDVPEIGMHYVRRQEMSIALDPDTRLLWLLSVDYQEVSA